MQIFVKTLTGKTIELEVQNTSTIDKVKSLIWAENANTNRTELQFAGKMLEVGHTLADYNIQNKSTIREVVRVGGVMQISVLFLDGNTRVLEVDKSHTIDDVIDKIQQTKNTGELRPGIRVSFGKDHIVDFKKTLAYYGIGEGSRIVLFLRYCC